MPRFYLMDIEEGELYLVEAPSREVAIRRWWRDNPANRGDSNQTIDEAVEEGDVAIMVFSEGNLRAVGQRGRLNLIKRRLEDA